MNLGVTVGGPGRAQIGQLARKMRAAPKDLRREVYRALSVSTEPLKQAAREGARANLPRSGGLAERVATSTIRAKLKGGKDPNIRLEATQTGVAAQRFKKARAAEKRRNRRRPHG